MEKRYVILIPLLLPVIDILTDHIFAISNSTQSTPAVAAVGCALLLNLVFGPMLYGENYGK